MRYLPINEIAVDNYEQACALAKILLDNRSVVCISREENLYIVNWEFSWYSDRNDMIFRSREDWDFEEYKEQQELQKEEEQRQQEHSSNELEGQMSLFEGETND